MQHQRLRDGQTTGVHDLEVAELRQHQGPVVVHGEEAHVEGVHVELQTTNTNQVKDQKAKSILHAKILKRKVCQKFENLEEPENIQRDP